MSESLWRPSWAGGKQSNRPSGEGGEEDMTWSSGLDSTLAHLLGLSNIIRLRMLTDNIYIFGFIFVHLPFTNQSSDACHDHVPKSERHNVIIKQNKCLNTFCSYIPRYRAKVVGINILFNSVWRDKVWRSARSPHSKEVLGLERPFCVEFPCSPRVCGGVPSGCCSFLPQAKDML